MLIRKLKLSGFKSFVEPAELRIEPGLTGVVGPNGCGKSNLLEAIRWVMGETSAKSMRSGGMDDVIFAGTAQRPPRDFAEVVLDAVDDGGEELQVTRRIERGAGSAYRVNGRDVAGLDKDALAALRRETFGFVFQRYNLLATVTAAENVEIPAIYAGRGRAERIARAHHLLARLGLAGRAAHRPGELSGGQQQRVSIARALMNDAPVILADEPTGALDSQSGEEMLALLAHVAWPVQLEASPIVPYLLGGGGIVKLQVKDPRTIDAYQSSVRFAISFGGGVEFKGWLWEGFSTAIEYRYTDLDSVSATYWNDYCCGSESWTAKVDQDIQQVNLIVKYRFGGM